jgi:MFS family permease
LEFSLAKGEIISGHPEAEYPRPAYAWYVVTILFLAYVVSFLDRQILSLLIEPIKQDLQLSDTMISLLIGFAFAIFYTIVGIPIGRMADSRNRKGIIIAGVSVWSLMTSLCGLAQSAMVLFLARIGVGIGEASLSPSAYSIISDYFPRNKRGRAASFYSLGIFAGAGLAFMFGGLISDFATRAVAGNNSILSDFRPWQITFIMTGLPGVLIVLLMLTVAEPARRERLRSVAGSIPLREVIDYLRQHWQAYSTLITGTAFISVASYSLFAWTPAYFIRVYHYTPREIGISFGAMALVLGSAGLILGSFLADRWFHKGHKGAHLDITIVMTGAGIIPVVFMLMTDTPTPALAGIACLILFLSVHTGLTPAALQLITPNELRGQVIALYMFILNLIGLGCGPTAVALLTDRYFMDTMAVGRSLAITIITALSIGVVLLICGRKPYVKIQADL